VDGILFSGGSHQSEHRFLKEKSATLRDTDPGRYDYEVALAREAYSQRLPIMGICRGHQTLVEALDGRVRSNRDLQPESTVEHHQSLPRVEPVHRVETVDNTVLRMVLGPRAKVNSLHRQAVAELPEGLRAAAHAPDGLIEAVVGDKPFVLGLQFHPEWLYDRRPQFLDFFKIFINQARK
jgi:putative glutamine amidotransferase